MLTIIKLVIFVYLAASSLLKVNAVFFSTASLYRWYFFATQGYPNPQPWVQMPGIHVTISHLFTMVFQMLLAMKSALPAWCCHCIIRIPRIRWIASSLTVIVDAPNMSLQNTRPTFSASCLGYRVVFCFSMKHEQTIIIRSGEPKEYCWLALQCRQDIVIFHVMIYHQSFSATVNKINKSLIFHKFMFDIWPSNRPFNWIFKCQTVGGTCMCYNYVY